MYARKQMKVKYVFHKVTPPSPAVQQVAGEPPWPASSIPGASPCSLPLLPACSSWAAVSAVTTKGPVGLAGQRASSECQHCTVGDSVLCWQTGLLLWPFWSELSTEAGAVGSL